MRCAGHLAEHGPSKGAEVAKATGVPNATTIMRDDHYGWFEKVDRGVYALTPKGGAARDEMAEGPVLARAVDQDGDQGSDTAAG
jgi:hypothetical protein